MRKIIATAALALAASTLALVAGCQPQPQGETQDSSRAESSPAIEVAWSADTDCATCHADQHDVMSVQHASMSCTDCHADEGALESVHEGKTASDKMPKKLKKTEVADFICESCHGSYGELAEATADSTALTDSQGTTVNPHEAKDLWPEEHLDLTCSECHNEHSGQPAAVMASEKCLSCHHEDVYECGTCHTT